MDEVHPLQIEDMESFTASYTYEPVLIEALVVRAVYILALHFNSRLLQVKDLIVEKAIWFS